MVHTVTTAPQSLADDSDHRLRQYLWTMGIRTSCFFAAVLIDSWVRWVFAVGAVVLPYFAVVIANAVGPRWGQQISAVDTYAALQPPTRPTGPVVLPDR